jgi:cation:H+ antiporter
MPALLLLAGFALADVGGDRFVRGAVGVSVAARIPVGIVGASVAAFATSSPELAVAVSSALAGEPELALGDATGSNLMNLGLVLGGTAIAIPLVGRWQDIRRELPTALAALALLGLLAADGAITRADAAALLALFTAWLVWISVDARRERSAAGSTLGERRPRRAMLDLAVGVILLIAAGRTIVVGAERAGAALDWDPFVVGTLAVAFGTSAPEMVTAVLAARRGHPEVGIGTVLGSNVFNTLFIVGVAAAIAPIGVLWSETSVSIGFGVVATVLALPNRSRRLTRWRGVALLGTFATWVTTTLVIMPS